MALADILAAITAETNAAVAELEAEGQARARTVLAEARALAVTLEQERADHRLVDTRRAAERIVNQARLGADRQLRAARAEVYGEARHLAEQQLAALRQAADYPHVLDALIAEALVRLPDAALLRVVAEDVTLVQRSPRWGGVRTEGSLQGWGGVVAVGDGRLVDNTLEARLRRAEPELRRLAGDLLPQLRAGAR